LKNLNTEKLFYILRFIEFSHEIYTSYLALTQDARRT